MINNEMSPGNCFRCFGLMTWRDLQQPPCAIHESVRCSLAKQKKTLQKCNFNVLSNFYQLVKARGREFCFEFQKSDNLLQLMVTAELTICRISWVIVLDVWSTDTGVATLSEPRDSPPQTSIRQHQKASSCSQVLVLPLPGILLSWSFLVLAFKVSLAAWYPWDVIRSELIVVSRVTMA